MSRRWPVTAVSIFTAKGVDMAAAATELFTTETRSVTELFTRPGYGLTGQVQYQSERRSRGWDTYVIIDFACCVTHFEMDQKQKICVANLNAEGRMVVKELPPSALP